MIPENSGKFYRFKLEHHLGFGFAEVYDFTDEESMLDGRIVYVYNRVDNEAKTMYKASEIRRSGIALGPIRLHTFPNTRGLHAWKFLFTNTDLIISELPETKELQAFHFKEINWDNFKGKWYSSKYDISLLPNYVDYDKVRHLETRIINSPLGVVKKFTMKVLIDKNENLLTFYNLVELGNRNMFVQMVNTYYPLKKTKRLLKLLQSGDKNGG